MNQGACVQKGPRGPRPLGKREEAMWELQLQGRTNIEIADCFGVTTGAVRAALKNARVKLQEAEDLLYLKHL